MIFKNLHSSQRNPDFPLCPFSVEDGVHACGALPSDAKPNGGQGGTAGVAGGRIGAYSAGVAGAGGAEFSMIALGRPLGRLASKIAEKTGLKKLVGKLTRAFKRTPTNPADPATPAAPRPGRIHVEPIELSTGRGRDFIIPGRSVQERFSGRLMDGSHTLEVIWTDSLRQTPGRLRQVQQLAGGPGSFSRITGRASADLEATMRAGQFDAQQAAQQLGNCLGGGWQVDVTPIPGTEPPQFNITAFRIGD